MYTATVYVVSAALILVLASIMFTAMVAAITVSYAVERASSAFLSFCRGWFSARLSDTRLLPHIGLRRVR